MAADSRAAAIPADGGSADSTPAVCQQSAAVRPVAGPPVDDRREGVRRVVVPLVVLHRGGARRAVLRLGAARRVAATRGVFPPPVDYLRGVPRSAVRALDRSSAALAGSRPRRLAPRGVEPPPAAGWVGSHRPAAGGPASAPRSGAGQGALLRDCRRGHVRPTVGLRRRGLRTRRRRRRVWPRRYRANQTAGQGSPGRCPRRSPARTGGSPTCAETA